MLSQKLFKSGNSIVMTIPPELRHELKWRDGSTVILETNGKELVVKSKAVQNNVVDAKFAKIVEEFMDEHQDVLKELSRR